MVSFIPQKHTEEDESHWISLSDMMTGLMMIFLLISISFMVKVQAEKKRVTDIVTTYESVKQSLYEDLQKEFDDDLASWGGTLEPHTLTIRFNNPEILFEPGKANINPNFKKVLNTFVPRYIHILTQEKYKKGIQEVRIEGHTSSEWANKVVGDIAYIRNMDLSQQRTRTVLAYVLYLKPIQQHKKWLMEHLTANGLSSSKLIITDGKEDKEASRRVEFRIVTNAENQIDEILKKVDVPREEDLKTLKAGL